MGDITSLGIIGGCGFVGLNIAEAAARQGIAVTLFDRTPPPSLFASLYPDAAFHKIDVADASSLQALSSARPDAIVFAAAMTSNAARDAAEPERVLSVNLLGFINVLRAAKEAGVRRVLNLSSVAAYGASGPPEELLVEDETRSRPATLYALSKFATEIAGARMTALWDIDLRQVRLSSLFGPWERQTGVRDTLSPHLQLMMAAAEGREALLPHAGVRDWTYAPDVAAAVLALMKLETPRHRLHNISRTVTSSVLDFGKALCVRWPGFRCRLIQPGETPNIDMQIPGDRPSLSNRRLLDDIGAAAVFTDPLAAAAPSADWFITSSEATS